MSSFKKISLQVFVFSSVFAFQAWAQWGFRFAANQEYNDNPFHLPQAEESWISSFYGGVSRSWSDWTVDYEGYYSDFAQLRERNFYWHALNLEIGSDTTNFALNFEQRIDKKDYDIFDYYSFGGNFNHRIFWKRINILLATNFEAKYFAHVQDLNNQKITVSLGFNRSFATRTTAIVRLNFAHKRYQNSENLEVFNDYQEMNMPSTSMASENFQGHGNGRHGKGGGGMMDWNHRGMMADSVYGDFSNSSVSQIQFLMRLAQSITPTLGVAVQYSNRKLIGGNDRYISGIGDSYSRESEIFNDPMGYESQAIGLEITKILPWSLQLKLSSYLSEYNFTAQGIYLDQENYDPDILREDDSKQLNLSLSKNFYFSKFDISVLGSYHWRENSSNSYWYDYKNQYGSLGLEFYF